MHNLLKDIIIEAYRITDIPRKDNVIHVSNLVNFCPREYALCQKFKYQYNPARTSSFAELLTFDWGDRLHESVQQKLTLTGHAKAVEYSVRNKEFGVDVVGSVDILAVVNRDDLLYPIELKSFGKEEFDTLAVPQVDHECQLSLYLWLLSRDKKLAKWFPDHKVSKDVGFVAYFCKLRRQMPLKVFQIKRNEEFLKRRISQLKEVKTFSEKKKIPKRICNSSIALMAKRCSVTSQCFGG